MKIEGVEKGKRECRRREKVRRKGRTKDKEKGSSSVVEWLRTRIGGVLGYNLRIWAYYFYI